MRGFCDFNSRLLRGDANTLSLAELTKDVLGEEVDEAALPAGDAAVLVYRLLCAHFKW